MPTVNAAIVTGEAVTVTVDGRTTPIVSSHPNYEKIRAHAANGELADIAALLDIPAAIEEFGEGRVTVVNGEVLYNGVATHNTVTDRILSMMAEGFKVTPMIRFLENLMENPSFRAVKELYGFLEKCDLPITPDGHFLAYKMVRDDYLDHHSGTFDNSVGKTITMPRNEVNEDPNQTCSSGLHVCSEGYLGSYWSHGRTMLCKVNPRDVVAVPVDYNNSKMRTCGYTVIAEVDRNTRGGVIKEAVYTGKDVSKDKATLATDVVSFEDAMKHFGINRGSLRKRLSRGATAKSVYVNGVEMVQIIDPDSTDASLMTFDDAMVYFDTDRSALNKRLNRGISAKRVMVNGVEMVKVITD